MSVDLPISPSLRDAHRAAVDEVNCWRGRCVDHFARIETGMAAAVAAMRAHPNGSALKRPTLFGGYVATLKDAVAAGGPFASVGADLREALERSEAALAERNVLIHATGRVLIERGEWVWLYRYQPTGANKPLQEGFVTKDIASGREKDLHSSRDRLRSRLEQLAALLGSEGTAAK